MIDATVLIVEDETSEGDIISAALSRHGATVLHAAAPIDHMAHATASDPDLVLLHLGLRGASGRDVCRELRRWTSVPIIVLSARTAEADKVALLALGADDYVCKPFHVEELLARIEAQLRRARAPQGKLCRVVQTDGLTIDLPMRLVRRGSTGIRLSPTEWAILEILAIHAGYPVRLKDIFTAVWRRESENPSQYLRVYVTHLRRKLERNPSAPHVILTEVGVGYRLSAEVPGKGSASPWQVDRDRDELTPADASR